MINCISTFHGEKDKKRDKGSLGKTSGCFNIYRLRKREKLVQETEKESSVRKEQHLNYGRKAK